jgi:hypothetical protein
MMLSPLYLQPEYTMSTTTSLMWIKKNKDEVIQKSGFRIQNMISHIQGDSHHNVNKNLLRLHELFGVL